MNSLHKPSKGNRILRNLSLCFAFGMIFVVAGTAGYVWTKTVQAETVSEIQKQTKLYPFGIQTRNGKLLLQVELADNPETRAMGLMWRQKLPDEQGMVFLFEQEQDVSFWMRNTLIPLDLIYIAKDGVINHIHPMARPLDETPLPSKGGPVIAVLEINGGQAAAKNIQIGDKIDSPVFEGKQ